MSLSERIMDIVVNEIIENDLEWASYINQFVPDDGSPETTGPFVGYKKIKITVVRPPRPIGLELSKFDSQKIIDTINSGYYTALETLK